MEFRITVRSVHSVSSSVLKNSKVFRTLCSAILQYFVKFYFCKLSQSITLCGIYFLRSMGKFKKTISQKLIPQKLVLAKINSLEVVAQFSFSVSWFLTLTLSKLCIPENSSEWWRDVSFLLTWPKLFFWSIN